MHILLLTQIAPYPPNSGPRVKTWNVLRYLSQRGHRITLVSFVRPEEEMYIPVLKEICDAVYTVPIHRSRAADVGYMLRSFISGQPFLVERDNLLRMQKLVKELVSDTDFDVIHADQLTMLQFALCGVTASRGKKPKVILDAHNAVWTILERLQENARWFLKPVLCVEAGRVKRYEGKLLTVVDHLLVVTDVDRDGFELSVQGPEAFSKRTCRADKRGPDCSRHQATAANPTQAWLEEHRHTRHVTLPAQCRWNSLVLQRSIPFDKPGRTGCQTNDHWEESSGRLSRYGGPPSRCI